MATSPDCRSPQCEVSVSMAMEQMNGNPSLFLHRGNRMGGRRREGRRWREGRWSREHVLACVCDLSLTKAAASPLLPPPHPPPHPLSLSFFLFSLLIANLQSCTADQAGTSGRLKGADDLEQKTRSLQTGGISLLRNQLLQEAEGAAARGTRQEGRRRTR